MKLLWVSSQKIGSKLIRWGLDADCSHFAVCFDEDDLVGVPRGIAFHAYGLSTQVVMLRTFLEHYEIVHALEFKGPVDEDAVYQAILNEDGDLPYDYPALMWFGWRALLAKIGFAPIGGFNRWQDDQARLCTGIAPTVLKALGIKLPDGLDAELTPPHELYRILSESGRFVVPKEWMIQANLV